MRRLLFAFMPALFSLCFILILLALLAAGTAAAQPLSSAVSGPAAPDRTVSARPASARPLITREPAPADTQLAAPVDPSAGSGDEKRLVIAEARLVASDVDAPVATLEIQVNYAHDWVAGVANSYATVVVTVTNGVGYLKADAVVTASESGDFFVSCDDWFSGQCPDIVPGDIVKVWATDLLNLINPVGSITGVLDESQNTVAGVLNANWFVEDSLFVNCEIWEEGGPPIITLEEIPTDGGTFTCDFDDVGWDLQRGHTVVLRYYEPDGDQVINIIPWPWMRVNYGHDWVGGNYAAGHTFTITVTDDLGNPKATAVVDSVASGSGWGSESFQTDQEWQPAQPDIQPYDIVQIKTEGYSSTIQVGDIGTDLDIAADQVGGTINAPWLPTTLNVECHPWGAWGSGNPWAPVKYSTAQPDNSSPYNCAWDPLTEWDIQLGQDVAVIYNEPDEDMVINVAVDPLEIRRVELWLRPGGDSNLWGEAYPGLVVTVTSPFGSHYNAWADPDCGGCWSIDNIGPLIPGDNIVVEAGAATQPVVVTTPSIDVALDTLNDDVSGQIVPWSFRVVEVYGDWPDGYRRVYSDINGNFLASYPDIPRGAGGYLRFEKEIDLAQVVFHRPFWAADLVLDVNYGHDWVQGSYELGHTVWITVTQSDGHTIKGTAELTTAYPAGWNEPGFSTSWQGWSGEQPNLEPGDWVYGKVDSGQSAAVQIGDINYAIDYGNDIIIGALNAPFDELLSLRCEVWGHPDNPGIDAMVHAGGGQILCDFGSAGYDLEAGHSGAVMYWEPDGDRVFNVVDWPVIRARIGPNSGGNRELWGHYAGPNATVLVTVTTSTGTFVDGETTTADQWGNWNTSYLPEDTLALWNEVQVDFGNGLTDTMAIYPLSATADPDTDVVEVTAAGPPFFRVNLNYCNHDGWCDSYDLGDIGVSGVVSANLLTERGFDVQPGDSYEAQLTIWNDHVVIYTWNLPTAEVSVWKNPMDGHARPGGVFVYSINYANQGNSPAENTLIVDTLPPGLTYAGDNSGVPVDVGPGNIITWHLGTVIPSENDYFFVTLNVAPDTPTGQAVIDQNCLTISSTTPGDWDPGNDSSCAGPLDVWDDVVEIGVDKSVAPDDPHPGQEFDYNIQWCNYSGAAAGPAVLTDTLPPGVTLLDWWVNDWFDPWLALVVGPDQLVLQAPGLPGNRCDSLTIRVLLDPGLPISTTLENLVEIAVADDVDPDNNHFLHEWARASPARNDLWLRKSRMGGILVPGGDVRFNIGYGNHGNVETTVRITDTLPPGFSYLGGWWNWNTPWPNQPIPEPLVSGNQLIWDLPAIPVSRDYGFDILLGIGPAAALGPTENCMIIAGPGPESYPDDNTSCAPFAIQPPGPNTWIEKSYYWQGDGQLRYEIYFGNFGDQPLSDVWITDTLPVGATWNGWWNAGYINEGLELIVDGNQLKWHFDQLQAGAWSWVFFDVNIDDPGLPMQWYTNIAHITLPPNDTNPDNNFSETTAFSGGEIHWLDLVANGNEIWGYVPRGPITIQTPYETDELPWGGYFGWTLDHNLLPGDLLTITASAGLAPLVLEIPAPFEVEGSSVSGHVWGQLDHLDGAWLEVDLWGDGTIQTQTDENGFFNVTFPGIPRQGQGEVRYHTVIDYSDVTFHRRWQSPDLVLNVNYGHDWIEGNYEPGHTVWITVTAADGVSIKGTAELWSGEVPWWGGNTGFSTNWHGWTSPPPDIAPGDRVFGKVDNGYTTTVRIFTIEGEVDVGADTAVGTITAPWLVGEVDSLSVQCQPWSNWDDGGNAPLKESIAPPDGSAPFLCQWDPLTEYDVEYFQDIGIWVLDPSGNAVLNALQGQGIDLMVDKWRSYLDDPTAPGGVIVYGIYYQNNGNIPAEDVQIVDVLPDLTGYAGDTSRLPYTVGPGNVITWQVGTLDPGQYALFRLTLNVSPDAPLGAGVIEPNCLAISSDTSPEANPGNEELCAPAANVAEGEIDVSVSKWAWPGDPAPGQNFYYTIEWCNNQPLDAGPAIMTDTLPAGTALVEWRETEWWRNYWLQESFDGHELAFFAPGLAGNVCGQIELTLALDPGATIGANLVNQVVLDVAGDVNPDDNTAVDDSAYVSPPRYDLVVDKRFNNGRLYPGGWINYFIDYRNNGNIDTPVTITETVPAGLIFDSAWWNGGQEGENQPLPMPEVVGDLLVWHLDTLPHGNSRWFHVQFYIDPDVPPGTEFGNCVTLAGAAADAWPDDNASCQTVTVNPPGPNLRVTKRHWWPNSEQIAYEITFYNTGTDSFYDVVMTDTLPSGVTAGYWPENDYYAPIDMLNHTADGYWWFSISEIQPGDAGHIWFDVTLDDPTLIPAWYTNIVTISTPPGDVNPSDNSYADLAGLLPDTVMRISPPEAQIPPDATITLDVTIDEVIDLYGLSVEISFDPAVLQVVDADPGKAGVQIEAGSCPLPDFVLANVADNSAGLINYDVSSLLPSPPCTGSGLAARITFRAVASGASPVHFAGWLLANSEAQVIELRTEDGQVIVSDLGLVQGKVELQGRTNHGGAEVCASDGAMVTCAISDAAGDYALWLPGGVYTVTAEIMSYLDGEKGGVTAGDGGAVTLAKVKLLGGDTNNDCTVNILDLSFMGARYSFALGDPGYDVRADINVDNVINILDIVLGGSNYRKSCPVAWP